MTLSPTCCTPSFSRSDCCNSGITSTVTYTTSIINPYSIQCIIAVLDRGVLLLYVITSQVGRQFSKAVNLIINNIYPGLHNAASSLIVLLHHNYPRVNCVYYLKRQPDIKGDITIISTLGSINPGTFNLFLFFYYS